MPAPALHRRPSPGTLLAAAWLLTVTLIAILQRTSGLEPLEAFACSPHRLLHGEVWTVATSALIIDGPPVGQLIATAAFTAWLIARVGASAFWKIALAGHIGATLLTYAGIGLLWLTARSHVEHLIRQPDFGISAVWAATLGALAVLGWRLGGGRRRILAGVTGVVALATFVVLVPIDGHEADTEHLFAFLIGIAVAKGIRLRRPAFLRRRPGTPTRLV